MYKLILASEFGGELYLGDISEKSVRAVESAFIEAGIDVVVGSVNKQMRLAANPASFESVESGRVSESELRKWLKSAMNAPFTAMSDRRKLLSTTVTIGEGIGSEISYPITKRQLESVDLEEAAINLAIFHKTSRSLLPYEMLEMLNLHGHIDLAQLRGSKSGKALRDLNNRVKKITTSFVDWMIDSNTKLSKSKLPAALGIGTPSDVEGWNYGPSDGSEGLQFMPNHTLVKHQSQTGQRSFYEIIQDLRVDLFELGKPNPDAIFKDRVEQTLSALTNRSTASCCAFSSIYCELVCLADGNQRNATRKDVLGRDFADRTRREDDDMSYNRMALGCRQTAFLANPYYFLRCLISAIEKRATKYAKSLVKYNEKVRAESSKLAQMQKSARKRLAKLSQAASLTRSEKSEVRNLEKVLSEVPEATLNSAEQKRFLKLVPPSVRLNVLSDYVWELISPDLLQVFDGKSKFDGVRYPRVQFYDYTKIGGRWTAEDRDFIAEYMGLDPDLEPYPMPENYHLTFSFAGTKKSLQDAECAAIAGQNITFAFETVSMEAGSFKTLFDPQFAAYRSVFESEGNSSGMSEEDFQAYTLAQELILRDRLFEFRERVFQSLRGAGLEGLIPKKQAISLTKDTLPSTHMGYEVINGDWSDLRFLDDYQKRDTSRAAVVGLKWKIPYGARFDVPTLAQYRYDNLAAKERAKVDAYLAASEEDRERGLRDKTLRRPPRSAYPYSPASASVFPKLGSSVRSQEAAAAFSQLRVSLDIALTDGLDLFCGVH
ncbi:MAG: GP88 family protein [Candidatus Thorarchaeota archaeon]|jgi:hypothetical protein